ncbi:MAG: amidohydrolase family protein [Synergistota bacterium]|nr:amidohydrolase family protein [Synergistota bacterium]
MTIDCHVHIYPPEVIKNAQRIAEKEPWFKSLISGRVHRWATAEDLFESMDRNGIDQAWVTGFAFRDQGLCRLCNDYVIETMKKAPERIEGMTVVDPMARGFEDEIARCAAAGMTGVGELFPDGQVFNIDDSRQTWRLAASCFDHGLFLMLHAAEPVGHQYPGKGCAGPKEAATFCRNHPEVNVIFAHWGGGLWTYETMPEMKICLQNAWYDTAATPFLYGPEVLRSAIAAGVGHKILFGTDFPILEPKAYVRLFSSDGLDENQIQAVKEDNAKTLLQRACDRVV